MEDNRPVLVEFFLLAQAGMGAKLVPRSRNETSDDGHERSEVRRGKAFDVVGCCYKAEQVGDSEENS